MASLQVFNPLTTADRLLEGAGSPEKSRIAQGATARRDYSALPAAEYHVWTPAAASLPVPRGTAPRHRCSISDTLMAVPPGMDRCYIFRVACMPGPKLSRLHC